MVQMPSLVALVTRAFALVIIILQVLPVKPHFLTLVRLVMTPLNVQIHHRHALMGCAPTALRQTLPRVLLTTLLVL